MNDGDVSKLNLGHKGPKQVFSVDQEQMLSQYIKNLAHMYFWFTPVTLNNWLINFHTKKASSILRYREKTLWLGLIGLQNVCTFSQATSSNVNRTNENDQNIIEYIISRWRFQNLCAQSYDGAASMQCIYSGLRTLIQKENPNAVYVWCFEHLLNLVVVDTCGCCEVTKHFF